MEWYSKDYENANGVFTYPRDWCGFNVPSQCLLPFCEDPTMIPDFNKYDRYMIDLIQAIKNREGDHSFYFIGTRGECALEHELAHAFYTVDSEYRRKADELLEALPEDVLVRARELLMRNNYHESTVDDEIQAHSATGLMWLSSIISGDQAAPFVELFDNKMDYIKAYYESS
jgi:hypothetical protein